MDGPAETPLEHLRHPTALYSNGSQPRLDNLMCQGGGAWDAEDDGSESPPSGSGYGARGSLPKPYLNMRTMEENCATLQAEVSALQEKLEAARDDYGSLLLYNLELKRQIANRLPSGAVRSIEQRLINEGGMERVMLLHQAAIGPGAAANNKEYVQLQASPFDRMPGVMPGASSGAVIQPQYNTVQAGASSGGLQATSQGWAASLQGGGLSRGAQPLQAAAGANQVCGQHIATLSQGLIVGMDGVGLVLQQPQQQPLQAAQPIQSTLLAGATSAIQPGLIMQGAIRPSGQLPSTQQLAMAQQRVHLHRQILLQDHHGLPVDKKPE